MDAAAMRPFGRALLAYAGGAEDAHLVLSREDGLDVSMPIRAFFRFPQEFSSLEQEALARCSGRVLDAGAGSGLHTLWLQQHHHRVVAIDLCREAVHVMRQRGVLDAREQDVLEVDGTFDTVVLLGHGIGMVGDLSGLTRWLERCLTLCPSGPILIHSTDVTKTTDPDHLAYHEVNRRLGRYVGQIRLRLRFRDVVGPFYDWLLIDPATLDDRARSVGWTCEIVAQEPSGEYLAQLTRP